MDGLDTGMRELASALSAIGEKVDRLTEVTLAVERMSTSTAAAVEACYDVGLVSYITYGIARYSTIFCVSCMVRYSTS